MDCKWRWCDGKQCVFENGRFFTSDVTQCMLKNRFFSEWCDTRHWRTQKILPPNLIGGKTILTNNMTQHTKGTLFMGNYLLPIPPANAQRVFTTPLTRCSPSQWISCLWSSRFRHTHYTPSSSNFLAGKKGSSTKKSMCRKPLKSYQIILSKLNAITCLTTKSKWSIAWWKFSYHLRNIQRFPS